MRELANAALPLRIRPGQRLIWDRRFEIITSRAGGGPFTIRDLGLSESPRLDRRAQLLRGVTLPRLLLPILPGGWDEKGIAAVPHLGYRREGVAGLPQIVFRPVTPLTQAGFAVV